MVSYLIKPSRLSGNIRIPPSKSQSLRAILFSMMAKSESKIFNLLDSPDIDAAQKIAKDYPNLERIDVGNSGILLRFMTAIAALSNRPFIVDGDESIRTQRPMHDLLSGLQMLGVHVESSNGFAPLVIQGPMKSGKTELSGHDSQPVSALLIAAACSNLTLEIEVTNPGEIPWVQLTLQWLDRFGVKYINRDYRYFKVEGKSIEGFEYHVPADLSSIAFPLAAAITTHSSVVLDDIDLNDSQGDKKIISILQQMGAHIHQKDNQLTIEPSDLQGCEIDINDCIDVIAPLAVISCFAKGKTTIRNAAVAREKECDRIHCLTTELSKMGAHIEELSDGLIIQRSSLKGAPVFSHRDHRMAMALSVAGLGAAGETTVAGTECIAKTFPQFSQKMQALGAQISEVV